MKYKSIIITQKGSPDVLKIVENERRLPQKGELLIKIEAAGVGRTDVAMRYGYYPFAPKIPFVPGYEVIGTVVEVGEGITQLAVGDCVAALTVYGGYSEYIYVPAAECVPVPPSLDPATAVALILNYVTAYQMLHRTANVKTCDKVLITGASGGVGTALLQLGQLVGLKMFATASRKNHDILAQYGAAAIDYKMEDFVAAIQTAEPDGLDFVFDGVGGKNIQRAVHVLGKGGMLVEYGYPGFIGMLKGMVNLQLHHWLPNGRRAHFYGITAQYRKDKRPFLQDLSILFELLAQNKIKPLIAHKLPILEAKKANELLEKGNVRGKIVLLAA